MFKLISLRYNIIMKEDLIVFVVFHNIFLTREERYSIHNGNSVETTGIAIISESSSDDKDEKQEILKEIFCKYVITYGEENVPVQINPEGFIVQIPHRPKKTVIELTDDDFRKLTPKEYNHINKKNIPEISSKNLLDLKDGGDETIIYRERNKYFLNGKKILQTHYFQILDMSVLTKSLTSHLLNPSQNA